METLECVACGCTAARNGPTQKYCRPCSQERDRERKRKWARDNYDEGVLERAKVQQKESKELARRAGAELRRPSSIAWVDDGPELDWLVRVAVPFSYAASKNHIWATTRKGHVYLREESKGIRLALTMALRGALGGKVVRQRKLWLDIFVQKPNHRGDAVNVVDLVCDAAKDAVGLDDRWFSLRRLDWEIAKKEPRLFVGVGQVSGPDLQACSYCGGLLPWDVFGKKSGNKNGIDRVCKDCRRAGRELAKKRRAEVTLEEME